MSLGRNTAVMSKALVICGRHVEKEQWLRFLKEKTREYSVKKKSHRVREQKYEKVTWMGNLTEYL